jgi:hypothetical protein
VITPPVYDATAKPAHQRNHGPGRLAHAYEPGEHVALCGYLRTPNAPLITDGTRCVACTQAAGQRQWVGR